MKIYLFLITIVLASCTTTDPAYIRDYDIPCVECFTDPISGLTTPYTISMFDLAVDKSTSAYDTVNREVERINTYLTTAQNLVKGVSMPYDKNLLYIWLVSDELSSDKNWRQFYDVMHINQVPPSIIEYLVVKRKNTVVYLRELRVLLSESYISGVYNK